MKIFAKNMEVVKATGVYFEQVRNKGFYFDESRKQYSS
jgi:hypothetical protein